MDKVKRGVHRLEPHSDRPNHVLHIVLRNRESVNKHITQVTSIAELKDEVVGVLSLDTLLQMNNISHLAQLCRRIHSLQALDLLNHILETFNIQLHALFFKLLHRPLDTFTLVFGLGLVYFSLATLSNHVTERINVLFALQLLSAF
jgi:acyl carrier protein